GVQPPLPAPPQPPTPPGRPGGADPPARPPEGGIMTEPSVSFAGNLTGEPEVHSAEGGIARAMFRVAVSGRRDQARPGRARRAVPLEGEPGCGHGPAPA